MSDENLDVPEDDFSDSYDKMECPGCGALVQSFCARCPECDYLFG